MIGDNDAPPYLPSEAMIFQLIDYFRRRRKAVGPKPTWRCLS
jgi:hypothetical protein